MLERLLRILRPRRVLTPQRRPPARARRAQPAPWAPASGSVLVSYTPNRDGRADPGEVVWTTVAFEDTTTQSKDRPVLIIGRRGAWLACLLLPRKSPGAGPNRVFMDNGRGPWDPQQRPPPVKLERLLHV